MGLYYHVDMNGGPWNDRWLNTTTIPKLREQFNLAYQSGIDDLWVVNVGDLKPKELPIDFIMRYAWNPDAIQADETDDYLRQWAQQNFGEAQRRQFQGWWPVIPNIICGGNLKCSLRIYSVW